LSHLGPLSWGGWCTCSGYMVGLDQVVEVEPGCVAKRVELLICDRQCYYMEAL
jgi:hypothetical protein